MEDQQRKIQDKKDRVRLAVEENRLLDTDLKRDALELQVFMIFGLHVGGLVYFKLKLRHVNRRNKKNTYDETKKSVHPFFYGTLTVINTTEIYLKKYMAEQTERTLFFTGILTIKHRDHIGLAN